MKGSGGNGRMSAFMKPSPEKKAALLEEGYVLVIGLTTAGHNHGFELLAKYSPEEKTNRLVFIESNVFSSGLTCHELNANSEDLQLSFVARMERLKFTDEAEKILELASKPAHEVTPLDGERFMLYNLNWPDVEMKSPDFEFLGRSPRLHWNDDMPPPYALGDIRRRFKTSSCGCRLEQGEDCGRHAYRTAWLTLTPCDQHKG